MERLTWLSPRTATTPVGGSAIASARHSKQAGTIAREHQHIFCSKQSTEASELHGCAGWQTFSAHFVAKHGQEWASVNSQRTTHGNTNNVSKNQGDSSAIKRKACRTGRDWADQGRIRPRPHRRPAINTNTHGEKPYRSSARSRPGEQATKNQRNIGARDPTTQQALMPRKQRVGEEGQLSHRRQREQASQRRKARHRQIQTAKSHSAKSRSQRRKTHASWSCH